MLSHTFRIRASSCTNSQEELPGEPHECEGEQGHSNSRWPESWPKRSRAVSAAAAEPRERLLRVAARAHGCRGCAPCAERLAVSGVPAARSGWIDTAKGIAILLMVFGHVAKGLVSSRIMVESSAFSLADSVLTSFRMPLLFFLAGLWLLPSVGKRGATGFVARRAEQLLWPYAVWMLLHSALMIAAGELTNHAVTWSEALNLWQPKHHYWFLYALFVLSMFGVVFAKLPQIAQGLLVLLSAVAYLWREPLPHALPLTYVWGSMVYLLLGAWLGRRATAAVESARAWWPALLLVAGAAQWAFHAQGLRWTDFGTGTLAIALLCIAAVCVLSAWIAPWSGWLQAIGAASLAIYVAHVIVAAAWRLLAHRLLGIANPTLHLVTGMLVGVVVPMLLYRLAPRIGLVPLFQWPRRAAMPQ